MADHFSDRHRDEPEVSGHEPADLARLGAVRDTLRALGADLAAATTAADRDDWTATLRAVRLIHGRALVTRGLLECTLGRETVAEPPPLTRAIQAIRRLIPERGIDSLPPDELRIRVRRMLQALDRELKAVLSPLDR